MKCKHLMFFIVLFSITALKIYPSLFIGIGGRDTWIGTIVASIIYILYAMFIIYVCTKTHTYDIRYIVYSVLGKAFGRMYLFLLSLTLFATCIQSSSVLSSALKTNLFLETPLWYLLLFLVVPGVYCLNKNFDTILDITLILVFFIIIVGIILAILLQKYKHLSYLLPIFEFGFRFKDNSQSVLLQLGASSIFFIAFLLLPKISDKSNLKKYTLISTLFASQILIFSMIGTISTFGPTRACNIFYPKLIQAQRIYYGGFLENGEFYVLFGMICSMFLQYIICIYVFEYMFSKTIYRYFKKRIYFLIVISLLIFFISNLIGKNILNLFNFLHIYSYITLLVFFVIPLVIYFLYLLKEKNKIK